MPNDRDEGDDEREMDEAFRDLEYEDDEEPADEQADSGGEQHGGVFGWSQTDNRRGDWRRTRSCLAAHGREAPRDVRRRDDVAGRVANVGAQLDRRFAHDR